MPKPGKVAVSSGWRSRNTHTRSRISTKRLRCCDWQGTDAQKLQLRDGLRSGKAVTTPFIAIALTLSPADMQEAARQWAAKVCPVQEPLWRGQSYAHERIRVAYVSANFNDH